MKTYTRSSRTIEDIPATMSGVVLTGHGGLDKLEYRTDLPVPEIGPHEVLIRVSAAAINNTDINTRVGWYSKQVHSSTSVGGATGFEQADISDATWTGIPINFPRIQGADCCGFVVAVGDDVDPRRLGERVIIQNSLRYYVDYRPFEAWCLGSEVDGAFAQFTKVPSVEAHRVESDWTDAQLASIPIAYSTAENMLHRCDVQSGERVLITGASGGVGSAAVQLAKRRGAYVIAIASEKKAEEILELGADRVIHRELPVGDQLGPHAVDVVLDVAGGPMFGDLLAALRRGGRYCVAGAIAGPIVELDLRTLYLNDLTFYGCTFQDDVVFQNLIGYIERDEIRPFVGAEYALPEIVHAQQEFLAKSTIGKIVLIIPPASAR